MNDVDMPRTSEGIGRKGAPPIGDRLSRDAVIRRATRLIEEEGFPAFSLRRLAIDLDVQPAALYNHVKDRDELLDAVAGGFIEQFEPMRSDLSWQGAIWKVAMSARGHLLSHPHLTDLLLARPAAVPATTDFIEGFIEVLERSGFDPAIAHATMHAVLTALLGTALQERTWAVDRTEEFEFLIDLIVQGVETKGTPSGRPRPGPSSDASASSRPL